MGHNLHIRALQDGVRVIELDQAELGVNTLCALLGVELIDELAKLELDPSATGVILCSAKNDSFVVGSDVDELAALGDIRQAEAFSRRRQTWLEGISKLSLPVVAAIHGPCLGAGLELALACRARICSDDETTRFATPEALLGLIPCAGGTQRLPRQIGVQAALEMILGTREVSGAQALTWRLVDEVVGRETLIEAAHQSVLRLRRSRSRLATAPLRTELNALKNFVENKELGDMLFGGNALGRHLVFGKGRELVQNETRGHYPAPFAALIAVEVGLAEGFERGLQIEAEQFARLRFSDVGRRLLDLHRDKRSLSHEQSALICASDWAGQSLGIVGAGVKSTSIVSLAAEHGLRVRMQVPDKDAVADALSSLSHHWSAQVASGQVTEYSARRRLAHVSACTNWSGLSRAPLVIESMPEDTQLKRSVLHSLESIVSDECVLASNTSSISISTLTEGLRKPERVVGMHFFSLIDKMSLLEVVVAAQTSEVATNLALALGNRLRQNCVVVRDKPGFFATRVLASYLDEAAHVLSEGAAIDDIDSAMIEYGFAVGPFVLLDEIGIDLAWDVAKNLHSAYGNRMRPVESLAVVRDDGRLGRKCGRGFYRYDGDARVVDTSVYKIVPGGDRRRNFDPQEIQQRLVMRILNEVALCLGESVVSSARDADLAAVLGLGFPGFRGGPCHTIDSLGADKVVRQLRSLRDLFGERFEPAALLVDIDSGRLRG